MNKSAEEIKENEIWCDVMRYYNVMLDELIQRHAYNNNSNTSQVNTRQDKTRQDKMKWRIHRFLAYNDNDHDNHYSMNSHGMKIIS